MTAKPAPWVRTKDQIISDLHKATNAYQERYRNAEEHLRCIADLVGESDDVGASWESVAAIIADRDALEARLKDLVSWVDSIIDMIDPAQSSGQWVLRGDVESVLSGLSAANESARDQLPDDLDPRTPEFGVGS